MFVLVLKYDPLSGGRRAELRGLVSCARDEAVPEYWVSLGLGAADSFARGALVGYRRWAEPVRGFLARALQSALSEPPEPFELACASFELLVFDWRTGRLVDKIDGDCQGCRERLYPSSIGMSGFRNPWDAAFDACAIEAFGSTRLPPIEAAEPLRLHHEGSVRYVRTSDLPLEAMLAAERSLPDSARPFVPGVPDAVHPWALEAFLNSRNPTLGPGQRWAWP